MKRSYLRAVGKSDTAQTKREIQRLLREIVMLRDGGCILRNIRHCNDAVLQADHLITRSNSATYADSRLVVCVCRSCHGWKSLGSNARKAQYDATVRPLLSLQRQTLWQAAEQDSWHPTRTSSMDWKIAVIVLQNELDGYIHLDTKKP